MAGRFIRSRKPDESLEVPAAAVVGAPLAPDHVERGPGAVFPAQDQVGAQLEHVEVGVGERVGDIAAGFPDPVFVPPRVERDLIAAEGVKAVLEQGGAGIGDALEGVVAAVGDEGLAVELDGELRGDAVVQAQGQEDRVLRNAAHDVAVRAARAGRCGRDIQQLALIIGVSGDGGDRQPVAGAIGHGQVRVPALPGPVVGEEAIDAPVDREPLARIAAEPDPGVPAAVAAQVGAAAQGPLREARALAVDADLEVPVVLELPLEVDVAADEDRRAAEVVAAPGVEVQVELVEDPRSAW